MDKQILHFTVNEQALVVDEPIKISTNKVNYIQANFDLGTNWSGYDSVRAVWFNDFYCISTVLDSNGVAFVPSEVMKRNGKVKVNLVGSISENDVLTDRLTSYPIVAVIVDCTAQINGAETAPITPSQFEQYVAIVRGLVDSVKDIDHIELNPDYTLTIYYSDGTSDTTGSVRGADGNGIESVTKTGTSGLVDTYTITFTDGQTTTFTVTNGAKGDTGNGIASIEKTSTVGLVDTYTITYTNGTTTTFTVTNGEKGDKGEQGDVSLAQLYAVYPTDTASGSIASFLDGADDVPMLSVVADIEPIQSGSGTPSPDNVRPIYGHTEEVVEQRGVNVWDEEWEAGGIAEDNGNNYTANDIIRSKNYTAVVPNTSYYCSYGNANKVYECFFYDADKGYLGYAITNNGLVTTPANCAFMRFRCKASYGTTYNHDISINYPSTDHDYHAYQGDTTTTQFGQTVYGGEVEVVGGSLTDKMAKLVLDGTQSFGNIRNKTDSDGNAFTTARFSISPSAPNLSSGTPNAVCSQAEVRNVYYAWQNQDLEEAGAFSINNNTGSISVAGTYADSTALQTYFANNNVEIVYEVKTPTTIQLTPQEIDSFKGQNNLWASTGSVEVEYRADIGLYIDKKLS